MTWPKYALLTWLALELIVQTLLIGKPREPITPMTAVANMLILAALAVLVVDA